MWIIFSKYDVTSELLMLITCCVFLLVMRGTKPKLTNLYILDVVGFVSACITIIFHQILLWTTCNIGDFDKNLFNVIYTIYIVLYITLLNEIFAYISLLSYTWRSKTKRLIALSLINSVIYFAIAMYPLCAGKLYIIEDGVFSFTEYQYFINFAGTFAAVFSIITTIINRNAVANIVKLGVYIFAPLEIIALYLDSLFDTVYLISFTYVIPFIMFFVLFHCSKYYDIVGCQSADEMSAQIDAAIALKKRYLVIYVRFPQLQKREYADNKAMIEYVASSACRKVENFGYGVRLYSPNVYTYALFKKVRNDQEAEIITNKVKEVLDKDFNFNGYQFNAVYKAICMRDNENIKDSTDAINMIGFITSRFEDNHISEFREVEQKDYEQFLNYHNVEQALLDIRGNNNLDDERILCFIQPIYDIKSETFRTGEALMRMKIDGKMIFPDTFIPVAEDNNCIHYLTKIMLNKVCKKIVYLEKQGYDFDAITVNCSTAEFENRNLHNELYEIIENSGINPSHVRLEITESIAVSNYDNVFYNMNKLKEKGLLFYLDDFGTGYSNLERIVTYPFDTIKFDKSILYKALVDSRADEMMGMLVGFFKKNGLKTVIEGVEDKEQCDYCKDKGFDYIQGYLFSKPQPCDNITDFFTK